MIRAGVLLIFLNVLCLVTHSQNITNDTIYFDVAFWKKQLHISNAQLFQLHLINRQMYSALYELSGEDCIESSNLVLLIQLWQRATLGVLTERQKKKWRKLTLRHGGLTCVEQRLSVHEISCHRRLPQVRLEPMLMVVV